MVVNFLEKDETPGKSIALTTTRGQSTVNNNPSKTRAVRNHWSLSHQADWDVIRSELSVYQEKAKRESIINGVMDSRQPEITNTVFDAKFMLPVANHFFVFGGQHQHAKLADDSVKSVATRSQTVKGKKTGKFAKSDWMDIEKQRGISVTSSVMQFDYDNKIINILDTPGHEDFSEDTYRTLMAVDSAVMVIDGAKGIEAQTLKLFKVCRMRGIPIFTFINKLDREIKDPLELLEEIEEKLEIETYPMNLPVGMGQNFFGIMDRKNHYIEPFKEDSDFVELDEEYNIVDDNPLANDAMYQKMR